MEIKKNADLYRRLKLYGFGVLLGIIVVMFIYKGKGCKMPGSMKLEELSFQQKEFSTIVKCKMECLKVEEKELLELFTKGKINYDKSEVRTKPCGTYIIEGVTQTKKQLELTVADCDTISKIITFVSIAQPNTNCGCE